MLKLDGRQTDMTRAACWGFAAGLLVAVVGGQFLPGYMTDSNARTLAEQTARDANSATASVLCQTIYTAGADSKINLAALRKIESSYEASSDADVVAAAEKAYKIFEAARIEPSPYEYGIRSACADRLRAEEPQKKAELKN